MSETDEESWFLLPKLRPEIGNASVERRYYENPSSGTFFYVRVVIVNVSDADLHVRLDDFWKVIRPNQCGGLNRPTRGCINERRMERAASPAEELEKMFAEGKLVKIAPRGGAVEYYAHFNLDGYNRERIDGLDTPFHNVSLDGVLEGWQKGVGQVVLSDLKWDAQVSNGDTDLVVPMPIRWGQIPPDSRVL